MRSERLRDFVISIPKEKMFAIILELTKDLEIKKSSRGRNPKYPLALIIYIAFLQRVFQLSYRATENMAKRVFQDVPDFSTYFYRLKTLDQEILENLIIKIYEKVEELLKKNEKLE